MKEKILIEMQERKKERRGVVTNVLNYDIVVNDFELQSRY